LSRSALCMGSKTTGDRSRGLERSRDNMARAHYVVTGGGGFLGKALCTALREEGHEVISLSRQVYPELHALGVKCVRCDLSQDPEKMWSREVSEALSGARAVFHVAAKVDMWGRYQNFFASNVLATR